MIHPAVANLRVEIDPKDIGRRIRNARLARNWKREDLAAALRLRPATIGNWERGERLPTVRMLVLICAHLRRSSDWMLVGVEKRGAIHRMARMV